MVSPADENRQPSYGSATTDYAPHLSNKGRPSQDQDRSFPAYNNNTATSGHPGLNTSSSEEESTTVYGEQEPLQSRTNEQSTLPTRRRGSHLTVRSQYDGDELSSMPTTSAMREQASRIGDDLELHKIERQVSESANLERTRTKSRRRDEHVDEFDIATNPVHEQAQVYKPVEHPSTKVGQFLKRVHKSNVLIRWITYITPITLILLIPLLLGIFVFKNATVGGVSMVWFMIWLEIIWLSLWAGRILAKGLPVPIGMASSLFTNNSKKWRDMGKQLELPATLFFWWLAIEVSFLPTMTNHQRHGQTGTQPWMKTMNKVLVSLFVGVILNFVEKILIQLIAISFHLRTYADRIEINKFQIGSLTKLYQFSKTAIQVEDSEFEVKAADVPGSGAITPGQLVAGAAETTKKAVKRLGDVAGKVAGDFTGQKMMRSDHPHQVVLTLLHTTQGSQVLARRLYRTFAREEETVVNSDDLRAAFDNDEEADAAFGMFDKDMNGDISMEELEAVCVEIGRERKSITASLKDLDSVVAKLDDVFVFIIAVITIIVFISLISTSASGVLTSAGSVVLALSWLFSATAQEFLQSLVFVFVKHPFDVGDRVAVYGNTGAAGLGDDYFVVTISLLYTTFKKMEGNVVQAPNSYLNTLFIMNHRRSGGLAEAVPISIKFGTTLEQIDALRQRLLDFVTEEKREYQGKILTELRDVKEVHQLTLNIVFFYKSNWQNEGLRLARRNKFICALMVSITELGIQGPRHRYPGQNQNFPVYLQHVKEQNGHPDQPYGIPRDQDQDEQDQGDPPFVAPERHQDQSPRSNQAPSRFRTGSILKSNRQRGESASHMGRRVDFSLGASALSSGDDAGDVYGDRQRAHMPYDVQEASRERERESQERRMSAERAGRQSHESDARTTGRDEAFAHGGLNRRSTDSGSRWRTNPVHRNRFFGRGGRGEGDEAGLMEGGLADVPESQGEHMDPRTGMVSPMAWRVRTADQHGVVHGVGVPEGHRGVGRAATEGIEMGRMR